MRLLYLSHRVPHPPNKGDKIRTYHQLRHLSAEHSIRLLSLGERADDRGPAQALRALCSEVEIFPVSRKLAALRCAAAVLGSRPLTFAFYRSRRLARRVQSLARAGEIDAVVACSSSMAPYAELVGTLPRVIDLVDVDSAKWKQYARFAAFPQRLLHRLEARRLQAYEARLGEVADAVVVATEHESALLRAIAPGVAAAVVRNGVDLEYFRPLPRARSARPGLIFTGQMDYFANVDGVCDFADSVLPRLQTQFPDLELTVVGRSPSARVRALGSRPGIQVTGTVDDVRPFLGRAWVFVAPLRIAQGVQNKVLEAMACGLPVVCSRKVLEGLADGGLEAGRHLLVAADGVGFAAAVSELLRDSALRQRISAAARRQVMRAYSWQQNMMVLENLLRDQVARPGDLNQPVGEPSLSRPSHSDEAMRA